jgi:glycosyltransferase involved in cell wall biosynthesis
MMDIGGIATHAPHLVNGLKSLGHTVDFIALENKYYCSSTTTSKPVIQNETGVPYNLSTGFLFPVQKKFPFKTGKWKQFTSNYDLVIWETPCHKNEFDGDDLLKPYDIDVKQIVFVHDGNSPKLSPHLKDVAKMVDYMACVHPSSLGSIKSLGIENCHLILNPQAHLDTRMVTPGSVEKKNQVSTFATFKAWKRVDQAVRAAPLFDPTFLLYGKGIEYHYMSGVKRKPKYGTIWDDALASGKMKHGGFITEEERDEIMAESKAVIDSSWSTGQNQYGAIFNRTMIEAIIKGTIPILCTETMKDNGIFTAGVHYAAVPRDATPRYFADVVNSVAAKDWSAELVDAQRIVKTKFSSHIVAEELLSWI